MRDRVAKGVVVLCLFLVGGCFAKSRVVCFLVDEDFKGVIRITEDANATEPVVRGEMVYYNLRGGVESLAAKTRRLESFHSYQAQYPSGKVIYGLGSASAIPGFVIRPLFVTSKGHFYIYIGPEDGIEEAEADARRRMTQ